VLGACGWAERAAGAAFAEPVRAAGGLRPQGPPARTELQESWIAPPEGAGPLRAAVGLAVINPASLLMRLACVTSSYLASSR
jgi:hypothetical protein